jgi:aquaporin Z
VREIASATSDLRRPRQPGTFLDPCKLDLLPAVQQRSQIALQLSGYLQAVGIVESPRISVVVLGSGDRPNAAARYARSEAGRNHEWASALTTSAPRTAILKAMVTTPAAPTQTIATGESTEVVSAPPSGVKYAAEAIGTFFLVFTVGAAVGSGSQFAPLAIGAVLMVMVYAGGHISGGHYNPAVTLSVLVRRRISVRNAAIYWIVQLGAGLLAAAVVRGIVDPARATKTVTMTLTGHALVAAFVVELLFTFALCYVVLNVATSKSHPDNSYFGLAIGFTVLAGAFAVGAISGGAFNPSVTVGAAVMGMFAWPTLWVYLVAQVIAGAAAGVTFRALNPDDK